MAEWYPDLYLGERAAKKKKKLVAQINRGRFYPGLYLITEAANGVDQLDIIESSCMLQKEIRSILPPIIGLAIGYDEAIDLIIRMAEETFEQTGTGDLLGYIRQKNK